MSRNAYDKAYWLSEDLIAEGINLDQLTGELLNSIYDKAGLERRHPSRHHPQLKILLLNFLKASEYPKALMTLPMSVGSYTEFQHLTYRVTVELLISTLLKMNWLSLHKGYQFPGKARLSRVRINEPLLEWLEKLHVDTDDIEREPPQLTLQYKNKDKRPVPIPEHLEAKALELDAGTQIINEKLRTTFIDLFINDCELEGLNLRMSEKAEENPYQQFRVDRSQRYLKRVFNNESFEDGGRFYGGWWQSIPSEYRKFISLNGDLTIEMDYSQFHPNILYNLYQVELGNRDAYDRILGPEHRDLSKQIFNACLNASKDLKRPPKSMKISHKGKTWKDI